MLLLIWCKPCYRDSHIWDISYYLHCPRRLCVNLHYLGENEVSNIRVYWFYFHKTVLNAAARVVSNAGKFDRGLTHLLHSELHWMFRSESSISSEWQFTGVSKARLLSTSWLLPPHIGRCQSSATSIFQPPPSCRTTTSSQHARPSGVLHRRSDGLECVAWRPPRPVAQCRQFPEEAEDASVSECTWTLSALEALRNALYKFKTYLLT